jgi:heme/copper-type cytochrome/quinol oxidase subunit 2
MQMKIIVESQEDFDKWISQQTVFKNSLIAQN